MGIELAIGLTAAALAGGAGVYKASEQRRGLKAQAQALEARARNETAIANDVFRQGEAEARQRSKRLAQLQGSNRVGFAGAGLLVGEGGGATQRDVWNTNADNAALDIAAIHDRASAEMNQHVFAASEMRAQGDALRRQGKEGVRKAWAQAGLGMATSFAGWGLGELGTSMVAKGTSMVAGNQFLGHAGLTQSGMDKMKTGSLIQSAGSVLSGFGGGKVGQSLYNTGIRAKSALNDFTLNRNRKRGTIIDSYGGY